MELRTLGTTGVKVSPLCLGGMMLGSWGNPDRADCIRLIHRALDSGVNFIDTADMYSRGESEEIVGQALRGGRRDRVVLASKVHYPMGPDPNAAGNSRRWITRAVDASLRRLGTDHIDLYQVHRWDDDTDVDDTLSVLSDLVRAGKIRYLGSSMFPASRIVEAQRVARRPRHERFVCEQPQYSILVRESEADVLPTCQRHRIGATVWSPLGGGWLSGKWRAQDHRHVFHRAARWPELFTLSLEGNRRKLEAVEQLAVLAGEAELSLIHLALAFVLRHPAVTSAIIGPRTIEHLDSQLGGATAVLTADVLDAIDRIVAPGTNVNVPSEGWDNPALAGPARRRA